VKILASDRVLQVTMPKAFAAVVKFVSFDRSRSRVEVKEQASYEKGVYTLIAISGEFDVVSEPQFTSAAKTALASGCKDFIVDLDGVSFLDGRALGALLDFFKSVRGRNYSARLVTSNAFHRRLFLLTGIDRILKLFDSLPQAAASLKKQLQES